MVLAFALLAAVLCAGVALWVVADSAKPATWDRRMLLYDGIFNLVAAVVGALFGASVYRGRAVRAEKTATGESKKADRQVDAITNATNRAERAEADACHTNDKAKILKAAVKHRGHHPGHFPAADRRSEKSLESVVPEDRPATVPVDPAMGQPQSSDGIDLSLLADELFPDTR